MHVDLEESRRCRSTDIMYHPDTLMIYRGTDLLTLLMIYYLLGKMERHLTAKYLYLLTLLI